MIKVKEGPLLKWTPNTDDIWPQDEAAFAGFKYNVSEVGNFHIDQSGDYCFDGTGLWSVCIEGGPSLVERKPYMEAIQACEAHAHAELEKLGKYFEENNKNA